MKKLLLSILILLAAVFDLSAQIQIAGTPSGGFYMSSNGGSTWNASNIAGWRVQGVTNIGTTLFAATEMGVYKSTDNGGNWTLAGLSGQSISDIVYTGLFLYGSTFGAGIYQSSDGGTSWNLTNSGLTTNGKNINDIAYDNANHDLYIATIDGVWRAGEGAGGWTKVRTGSFMSIGCRGDGAVLAGTNSAMYISIDRGNVWNATGATTDARSIVSDGTNFYVADYGTGIRRTTDNGNSWSLFTTGLSDLLINKLMYDATGLYAGGTTAGVFKSINSGASWTQVNNGISNMEIRALASYVDPTAGRIKDSLALVEIYNSLDGPNWWSTTNNSQPWLTGPINDWYGVTVNSNFNRVTQIYLGSHSLKGSIPNAIGRLDSITYLNLSYNRLSGSLPDSLFQLKALNYLDIQGARNFYNEETQTSYGLTGSIPGVGYFTNLKRLQSLYIGGNKFTGNIPTFWTPANMPALRNLDLTANDFTGPIPSALADATQLTYLRLAYNQSLTAGGLPSTFANLTNLTYLDITGCNLTGLPNLQGLTNLTELNIGQNQLTGAIPSWIGNLTGLLILQTRYNPFDRGPIPTWIYNLTNLNTLMMEGDSLTGNLDPKIGRLTNLNQLSLSNNMFSGTITDSIKNLVNLTTLQLNENQFTGAFPSIPNLVNLYSLYLYSNQLTDLPNLSALTNLNNFSVYVNKFTFEDIEPNLTRFSGYWNYSPQDSIGVLKDTLVSAGQPVTMSVASLPIGGTGIKSYQWLKDGIVIPGATNSSYTLTSAVPADEAPYVCQITDGNVPGLTLTSRTFNLRVVAPPLATADSLALIAIYDSLNGVNWNNQLNWKTSNPVSTWYGITLTSSASSTRVTAIEMYNNNLAGRIPAAIGNLDSLKTLNFGYNKISGTLPDQITNLKALMTLDLYGQSYQDWQNGGITGPIPANLGNMTALTSLHLGGNKLTGSIPTSIGSLTRLRFIWLYSNQLTGFIPAEFWNLTSLETIDISGNAISAGDLSGAPITNLTALTQLNLSGCGITLLPNLSSLSNLSSLYIGNNLLTGSIPSWIQNIPNLGYLDLSSNRFAPAPLPAFFSNMPNLLYLILYNDSLTGAFPSLVNSTGMYFLQVNQNQITDFPDLSTMTNLNNLYIDNNKLNFSDIQPNIKPGRYIQYSPQAPVGTQQDVELDPGDPYTMSVASINVGGSANQYQWMKNLNDIPGATSIDYSIVSATPADNGAYVCKITDNNVPGLILNSLPFNVTVKSPTPHLGDSLALVALYDSLGGPNWSNQNNWKSNQPINTWYGISVTADANFTRVSGISLSNNNLQGRIPSALGRMDSLKVLDLYSSALSGSITDSLYALQELQVLKLTRGGPGGLTGSISPKIGRLTKLRIFEISYNNLSGVLPDSLFMLTRLERLEMNYSGQFNSSLSPSIGNLTNLTELYMSGNQFTGNIPTQIGNLTALTRLDLSQNQLSGSIPSQIWGLTNLQTLNLSYNIFTPGPLPAAVQNLSNLNYLFLNSDSLTGSIPDLFGSLSSLYYLDLSRNQFTGTVPASLAGLTNIQYLYLNRNQLDSLPDLSALNLYNLDVAYNRFDFGDLIPNIGAVNSISSYNYFPQDSIQGIAYSPQDSVNTGSPHQSVVAGRSFKVSAPTYNNGSNAYQWYRKGSLVLGATGSSYSVSSASASNVGSFYCRITNPTLPNLTLYTKTIRISIETAPATPQLLSLVPGNGTAALTWLKNPDNDIRTYRIYAGQSPNPTTLIDSTATGADTSKTLYGLPIGQLYYFRIIAADTLGFLSPYSNELNAIIKDAVPPAQPTGFTAYAGNDEVKLFWNLTTGDADLSHFVLYRSTTPGFTVTPADSQGLENFYSTNVGSGATTYYPNTHIDLNVNNGTTYYYKLRGIDSSGNYGALSPELSVTPSQTVAAWINQAAPSSGIFYEVKFTNPRNGYIATQNGAMLRTTDGGQNWITKPLPVNTRYRALEFVVDTASGWVGGDGGNLFLTNDGGDSWTQQVNTAGTIRDITFLDDLRGWLGGTSGAVTKGINYTTNTGSTWNAPSSSPIGSYRGVSFTDNLNGWATKVLATPAQIYKTIDGGQTWSLLSDFGTAYPGYSFRYSQMVNASTGYVVGGSGTASLVLKTNDGGNSWADVTPPSFGVVQALDFVDVNNGWIATDVGLVFHTTNGGTSWEFQSTRSSGSVYSVDVIDGQGLGWLTRADGAVYKLNKVAGAPNQAPVIALTAPSSAAGDTGWGGRTGQIRWSANDDNGVAKVVVEYASNGVNFTPIGESFVANGAFVWDIPDNESTVNAAIRVTAYDQQGLNASAQSIAPISIFPNGSYTHATSLASLTVQNNGLLGTGLYGYNKPSFQYPLGDANSQLFTGKLYMGFVRNIGDTVGVSELYSDHEFRPLTSVTVADFGSYKQSVSTYSDNFGAGVEVQQTTVSENDDKFFVVKYDVTNKSGQAMNSLALGQWLDFDVKTNPALTLTGFDLSQFLAYMYNSGNPNSPYVGVRMLDADPNTFRRLTNTQAAAITAAGKLFNAFAPGADVTASDSSKNYSIELGGTYFINPNQTISVTFAICAGSNLADLQSVAAEAQDFWTNINTPPATPTGLTATPVSHNEINLEWNLVSNASRYRVYRSLSSNSGYVQIDSVSSPATTYVDSTGLQPVTLYFYKIAAVNGIGTSALAAAVFAQTNTPPAPAAPTNLIVTTVSTTALQLDWTASVSSNITKYKIYRRGPSDVDFVQIDSVPEVVLTYTNTGLIENSTYFYKLIAAHPWGVSDFTGQISGNTMQAVPAITDASVNFSPSTPSEGQQVTVSVPVNGSGLTVKLLYGKGFQLNPDSVTMTLTSGTTYSGIIPGAVVSYQGVWFKIKAINNAGVDIFPTTGRQDIDVSVSNNSVATIISNSAYPLGVEVDGYSTISLPLNTTLNLVSILGTQQLDGSGVPTNWRAVTFNANNQTFTNVTSLQNNTAYFIFIRGDQPVTLFSDMAAGNTNPKSLFDTYILRPGWNLVPWPFAFSANITVTDAAKIDPIWQMTAGSWSQVSQVKAFGGYAIKNKTGGNLVLGTVVDWTPAAGKHLAEADWKIRFKVESAKRQDYYNYIAVAPTGAETYDIMDVSEPMSMGGDVSLYFKAKNELDQIEKVATDVRSDAVDGNVWEMTIANNVNEKALTLNWELPDMPADHKMMIVDVNNNEFINMAELQTYRFNARKDNRFKVVVGKGAFVDQAVEKIRAEMPREYALQQNYPNPFNPSTNIRFDVALSGNVKMKIYNVLGQEVVTLVDGYFETGRHLVTWNGRDALGRQVASGMYIYRLEAGKVSRTKKMLFVK